MFFSSSKGVGVRMNPKLSLYAIFMLLCNSSKKPRFSSLVNGRPSLRQRAA
jgi:hypothetical protein